MTDSIPPLNHRFTIPAAEAEQLWTSGLPMPPEARRRPNDYSRIRRSENGLWVVRRHTTRPIQALTHYSSEKISRLYTQEIERLQELGLKVISFANVPAETEILTVSPWIDGIAECPRRQFAQHVHPLLRAYFSEWAQRPTPRPDPFDITKPAQYSVAPVSKQEPFLHDVDARIAMVF